MNSSFPVPFKQASSCQYRDCWQHGTGRYWHIIMEQNMGKYYIMIITIRRLKCGIVLYIMILFIMILVLYIMVIVLYIMIIVL